MSRLLGAVVVFFAACSRPSQDSAAVGETARTGAEETRLIGMDSLALSASAEARARADSLNRERDAIGVSMMFYVRGDSRPEERPGFTIDEAPCGYTVMGHFKQIPLRDSLILVDPVLELDPSDKVIREWGMPTSHSLVAVQEAEIIVGQSWGPSENRSVLLAIDTAGRYRALARVPVIEPRPMTCPSTLMPESAYRQCARFLDMRNRSERRIAYEGQCS